MVSNTLFSLPLLSLLSLSLLLSSSFTSAASSNSTVKTYGWWKTLATIAPAGDACGYGDLNKTGYGTFTTAVSEKLYGKGAACGSCYEVECLPSKTDYCKKAVNATSSVVTVTNYCAGTNSSDGFCNRPHSRFALSPSAFVKIGLPKGGIINVRVRRVPCVKIGGIAFRISGNPYFLLVLISNVGASGDLASVEIKANLGPWIAMYRNYGAVWSVGSDTKLSDKRLSFRVRSLLTNQTLVAENVAPRSWKLDSTYISKTNFVWKNSTTF